MINRHNYTRRALTRSGPSSLPPAFASRITLAKIAAVPPTEGTVTATLVGQTVSRYTIREQLRGGGMGDAYKTEDIRIQRAFAIKPPPEFADDSATKEGLVRPEVAASGLTTSVPLRRNNPAKRPAFLLYCKKLLPRQGAPLVQDLEPGFGFLQLRQHRCQAIDETMPPLSSVGISVASRGRTG